MSSDSEKRPLRPQDLKAEKELPAVLGRAAHARPSKRGLPSA